MQRPVQHETDDAGQRLLRDAFGVVGWEFDRARLRRRLRVAVEKEATMKSAKDSGHSTRAFSVSWALRDDAALKQSGVSPMDLAREAEALLARLPQRGGERRRSRLRAGLYRPLLALQKDERSRVVDVAVATLLAE